MRKILIRIGVLAAVFFAGIFVFSRIMNTENADNTQAVAEPEFPVVYIWDDDRTINEMFGYAEEMQVNYVRDTLTVLPEDYHLLLAIDTFGTPVQHVSYEVRSSDGERLVEETDITYITEKAGRLEVELPIKKLLEKETEYVLRIMLNIGEQEPVSYYTRIIDKGDYDYSDELDFCLDFSERTFDSEKSAELSMYLEPNADGDNTDFGRIDIHSNFRMLTYQGLNARLMTEPAISVMEARSSTVSARVNYLVSAETEDGNTEYYTVTENFRVRSGDGRMYLLDYERVMNQLFMQNGTEYGKESLYLGILSEEPEYQASADSKIAAFVQQGVLWSYNNTSGQMTRVFGMTDDFSDVRKRHCDYEIRIADVDETGSMDFLVCGYMNQGRHEGSVGILACRYDATSNTVEELAFIPYDKGYAQMRLEIGQLAYINRNQELYCMLDGTVYCIDLIQRTYEVVVQGLTEDCYVISEDGQMFAWLTEKDYSSSDNLGVLNLETGFSFVISSADYEKIRPVGFMGHDLVYGLANADMIQADRTGNIIFPMKRLHIVDESGKDVREYEQKGIYVTGTELEEGRILLKRMSYSEESRIFTAASEDQIISNEVAAEGKTTLECFAAGDKKTQYRLRFSSELKNRQPQVRHPKEIVFELSREVHLEAEEMEDRLFYVYGRGRLDSVSQKAGEAIARAEELQGVVVNADMDFVWEKGNRVTKTEITGIMSRTAAEDETSITVCLELMLNHAGVYEDVSALQKFGMTPLEILEEFIPGQVVDLSGCSLDAALYFSGRKVPVFAMKDSVNAVLILGYDQFGNTILADPVRGTKYKVGPNDSKKLFDAAGNIFISYIP